MSFGKQESAGKQVAEQKLPEQKEVTRRLLDLFAPTEGFRPPELGPFGVAPLTQTQQQLFGTIGDFATDLQPLRDTTQIPLFGEAVGTAEKLLSGEIGAQPITPQQTEDFFTRALALPQRRAFEEETRPLIREEFAGPGFSSSARALAVTEAGRGLEETLGAQRGTLEFEVLRQNQAIEQQKALVALNTLPIAQQLGFVPENIRTQRINDLSQILNVATFEQLQEQAVIDEEIERFAIERLRVDPDDLATLMALLGMSFSSSFGKSSASSFNFGIPQAA